MILLLSALLGSCLLVVVVGIDMLLYKESALSVLYRIFIQSNSTGKAFIYGFLFITFSITVILDIYRYRKMKENKT
ncbi:hypothetical protein [Priestia abyssalis]|uniref:hypothetical protein n=1 Tax=Priestia abyssalis TaxID=1221450 RepID=UPI00099597E7|nr:hypothetical protein [Priestia abyssalis]